MAKLALRDFLILFFVALFCMEVNSMLPERPLDPPELPDELTDDELIELAKAEWHGVDDIFINEDAEVYRPENSLYYLVPAWVLVHRED
jgi:hypothetical protein